MANPEETVDFFNRVEKLQTEITKRFSELIDSLRTREAELLQELETISLQYRDKIKEQEGMRLELETTKKLIEENINYSDLRPLQQDVIAKIEEKLKHMRIQMQNRNIEFVWREQLISDVTRLGSIRVTEGCGFQKGSKIDYKKKVRPALTVTNKGNGEGELDFPWGVAVDNLSSKIYVADHSNHRVQVFSQEGNYLFTFGETAGEGKMHKPLGICISDGRVFVSQFSEHCILIYKLDGVFMNQIGCSGKGEGQLNNPYSLAINEVNGDIYVCDGGNNRIQIFSTQLSFITILWQNTFRRPVDIKLAHQCIFVLDESNPCMHVFNSSNHAPLHSIINRGCTKQICCSYFFCLDADCNIYMTDFSTGFVYVFDKEGVLIHQFGGLHQPLGIALDINGRIIIVNNKQEDCLQMW
ncbi:hypothetical protein LOD99_6575 [Oopsacas minuta]|uniref:Uncharacterized protein n=1 Tax=Oopsacas minuta TaxID=111878 RepID=A0AAV7JLI6_9METZ|nr:hypothetical protein LOD99_6575 [Oopsacas minuta]